MMTIQDQVPGPKEPNGPTGPTKATFTEDPTEPARLCGSHNGSVAAGQKEDAFDTGLRGLLGVCGTVGLQRHTGQLQQKVMNDWHNEAFTASVVLTCVCTC
jgi:hypothetical protein